MNNYNVWIKKGVINEEKAGQIQGLIQESME